MINNDLKIKELDQVVLTRDRNEYGLREGDVGVVVHMYPPDVAFIVEFVTTIDGFPVALIELEAKDIRLVESGEIIHIRKLEKGFKRFIFNKILNGSE